MAPPVTAELRYGSGAWAALSVVDHHFFHLRAESLRQRNGARLVVEGTDVHPSLDGTGPGSEVIDE